MKKWLFLLRSFFPSWKFFDDIGPELRLEVRFGSNQHQLGEWVNGLPPIQRSYQNLLFNPRGTYLHACHNHLNHFNSDITESDESHPEQLMEKATYKITRNLAQFQIQDQGFAQSPFVFQFRLSAYYLEHQHKKSDQILVSPVYEVP